MLFPGPVCRPHPPAPMCGERRFRGRVFSSFRRLWAASPGAPPVAFRVPVRCLERNLLSALGLARPGASVIAACVVAFRAPVRGRRLLSTTRDPGVDGRVERIGFPGFRLRVPADHALVLRCTAWLVLPWSISSASRPFVDSIGTRRGPLLRFASSSPASAIAPAVAVARFPPRSSPIALRVRRGVRRSAFRFVPCLRRLGLSFLPGLWPSIFGSGVGLLYESGAERLGSTTAVRASGSTLRSVLPRDTLLLLDARGLRRVFRRLHGRAGRPVIA